MGLGTKKITLSGLDINVHMYFGFFIRFFLIMYGEHHDNTQVVKYTDIDYHVFTDAASEILKGGSPFDRYTYRYTPFLAMFLIPNVKYNFLFGKFLFSVFDCISTKIIHNILVYEGHTRRKCIATSTILWLYNPIVIAISTRGSAESIMAFLILLLIYFLKIRLPVLSGVVLGIAIHFKLYPVIYILPIYISFTVRPEVSSVFKKFGLNLNKIKFLLGVISSYLTLTVCAYTVYGDRYIEESLLYHIKRRDTRHNFSVYFYVMYLCTENPTAVLSIATFVPQLLLTFIFGYKYSSYRDLPFAMFTQTLVFVTFNKVVTSQYFIWYLVLLPFVSTRLSFSAGKIVFLVSIWFLSQASWLLPAFLLEFYAINSFVAIWLESIAFFCCNVGILLAFISGYTRTLTDHHHIRKNR